MNYRTNIFPSATFNRILRGMRSRFTPPAGIIPGRIDCNLARTFIIVPSLTRLHPLHFYTFTRACHVFSVACHVFSVACHVFSVGLKLPTSHLRLPTSKTSHLRFPISDFENFPPRKLPTSSPILPVSHAPPQSQNSRPRSGSRYGPGWECTLRRRGGR